MLFSTFDSKSTKRPKIFCMAIFIVLWPYLLTTKLRCLQKNNIGHTINLVLQIEVGMNGGQVVNNGKVAVFACGVQAGLSILDKERNRKKKK